MTNPLSLEEWKADPAAAIDRLFAPGGPAEAAFARLGLPYSPNPVQIGYAKTLAAAAARGCDPRTKGRVTPVEASTGIGKSFVILCVAGISAVLAKKPAVVTTYTRFLNRQLNGQDGAAAAAAVEALTGMRPKQSVYRPRSAFASPGRIEAALELLALDDGQESHLAQAKAALGELRDWTLSELEAAESAPRHLVGRMGGLVETFVEAHPQHERVMAKTPMDYFALDPAAPASEQACYEAYAAETVGSDVVVATHAALIRQMTAGGRALSGGRDGICILVADEANRIEEAGKLALGVRRSVGVVVRETSVLLTALSSAEVPDAVRRQAAALMVDRHLPAAERAMEAMRAAAAFRHPAGGEIPVTGREAWIDDLREGRSAAMEAMRVLAKWRRLPELNQAMETIERRERDVGDFLDCVEACRIKAEEGRVPENMKFLDTRLPFLSFSPTRTDPSVVLDPKYGGKALALLWRGETMPADAVVLTSATLATPGLKGAEAFASVLRGVGLGERAANVNRDLASFHEMRDFGKMEAVVLASPEAPVPGHGDGEEADPGLSWAAYVAGALEAALADDFKGLGTNKVIALATSFLDAAAIGREAKARGIDAIVRTVSDPVGAGFDALEARGGGLLVTVGAFDGINRPGFFDHLVIPRLPFPPSHEKTGAPFAYKAKGGESVRYSHTLETMLRMLRQGIGRAFRSRSDRAKVWILDPRFGLPESVERRLLAFSHSRARKAYQGAFPERFRNALDQAEVYAPQTGSGERKAS